MARQIAKTVLYAVAFVLILVLWTILSRVLDLAFKLPVLSTLNRWSGGVMGLCEGVVLVVIGYKYYVRHGLPPVGSDGKLRA